MALSDDIMKKSGDVLEAAVKGALYVGLLAGIIALGITVIPGLWGGVLYLAGNSATAGIGHILMATGIGAAAGGVFFGSMSLFPSLKNIKNYFRSSSNSQPDQAASLQQPSKQVSVSREVTPTVVEGRKLTGAELAALGDAKSANSAGHSV